METPYPLGRVTRFDPRSLNYPARAAAQYRTVTWRRYGEPLYQLDTSSCTGHDLAHCLNSKPLHKTGTRVLTHQDAMRIYSKATQIDPFPWTYPPTDEGSSVLAAAKVVKAEGLISGYSWAFGLDHVLRTLTLGPVALGTTWYVDMFEPAADGTVSLTGGEAGGHAYAAVGIDADKRRVLCQNSWGRSWGINSRFWLTFDQLGELLADHGEALSLTPS